MDHDEIRIYLLQKGITAYELAKETGLSTSGMDYFLNGDSKPRRKTLEKINEYVEKLKEETEPKISLQQVSEPAERYNSVSNNDIFNAIQHLTNVMSDNGILISDLLSKTYQNTKTILSNTREINDKTLQEINERLIKLHHE